MSDKNHKGSPLCLTFSFKVFFLSLYICNYSFRRLLMTVLSSLIGDPSDSGFGGNVGHRFSLLDGFRLTGDRLKMV